MCISNQWTDVMTHFIINNYFDFVDLHPWMDIVTLVKRVISYYLALNTTFVYVFIPVTGTVRIGE